jgi:hypothetical protein
MRVGLTGIGILVVLAYLIPGWLLWLRGSIESGGFLPLIPVVVVLLLLGLRRLPRPFKPGLTSKEIRVLFGILTLGIAGIHAIGYIIALLPMPYYFATPENDYEGHFLSEVPTYLTPYEDPGDGSVPDAIVWFYRGTPPGESVPWEAWIGPLAWWIALLALIYGMQICLGALLRRQWEEHEKLLFPHVTMLTSLLEPETEGRPSIWRDRLFWTGVAVSAFILLLDGLKHYFPGVPAPELHKITLKPFMGEAPWREMRSELKIQPYLVAISYMLTTEISLSVWLIGLIDNFLRAFASAFGMPTTMTGPWFGFGLNAGSDAVGAIIVFVAALFWTARRHLKVAFGLVLGKGDRGADSEEGMGYPAAVWGFWLCTFGVLGWCSLAGLSIGFSILVFGLYTISMIFLARFVSETGIISARVPYRPNRVAIQWVGFGGGDLTERALGQVAATPPLLRSVSVFSFLYPSVLMTGGVMADLLTGMRAATSESGSRSADAVSRKRVLQLGFLGTLVTTIIFAYQMISETYARGALHSGLHWLHSGTWIFENELVRDTILREHAQTTSWTDVGFVAFGALVMGLLLYLRRAFYWWPIHPIGYIATGISRGLWFSVFLGWTIKRTILKYGGGDGFKRSIPFFVGLFVGQYIMAALWYMVGVAVGELQGPFGAL